MFRILAGENLLFEVIQKRNYISVENVLLH